jgi:anti-sigma regulatory factor (Ser/Thr protein kinase)
VAQEYSQPGAHPHASDDWSVLLPGTPDSLPRVRAMITQAATRCGFSEEEIAKIEMAVDEACTNIIEHAYHAVGGETEAPPLEIEVHAREHPDRLEITILDHSLHNFPVDEKAPAELEEYFAEQKKRGLGLFIIRSFVDDVKHRFVVGHGNELLLIKYFA